MYSNNNNNNKSLLPEQTITRHDNDIADDDHTGADSNHSFEPFRMNLKNEISANY